MTITRLLFAILLSFASLSAYASETIEYTVLLVGNTAGKQTTEILDSGERRFTFEYSDRGRGPKLNTRMILDQDGLQVLVETKGNDYLKAPVEETFSLEQRKAHWKNQGENGTTTLTGKAFYSSMNGVPEETGLLARALLSSSDKRLRILPEGEAQIERVGELQLASGDKTRVVVHYAISGLGFAPVPVWLNQDRTFFASVSPWLSTILKGWESAIPGLIKAQDEYADVRASRLARELAHKPSGLLAIRHARLFDSQNGSIMENRTVIVSGNRIQSVGSDEDTAIPEGAELMDVEGKVLLPGLWDMHVHLSPGDGLLHMAAGVTSVRDLANDIETVMEIRRKFNDGSAIGPRVILAGFIDGPGPYAGPTKVLVNTEQEAREAVRRYVKLGYEQIKIYSSVKPELVPAIIDEAHRNHLRVSGHIPAFMTAEQAVKAGYDEIQHENFLFLNFLFDTVKDTRTPQRFIAVAQHAAELNLDSKNVKQFIQLLNERKTVVDPTLNVFELMFVARAGIMPDGYASVARRLLSEVRRGFLTGGLPVPEGMDQRYKESFAAMLRLLKKLYDSNISIVAGTDDLAGFSLHRELELYVAAGIPSAKVLQLATLGAASVMKREKELGSIVPGKLADMILVNGNPLQNISDIEKIRTVIKDGVVYQSADLYKAIGVQPAP